MSKKNKRNRKSTGGKRKTAVTPNSAASNSASSGAVKRAKAPEKAATKPEAKPAAGLINRRNAIKLLIGLPVVGAAGAAIHRYDVQNRGLHDLSVIGQGKSVVVQIHDSACSLCRRLMSNARSALDGNDDILFKVADVTSSDGEAFRQQHHGETVSLILFDAKGRRRGIIRGVQTAEVLKEQFLQL
jgi:hypothetical protein